MTKSALLVSRGWGAVANGYRICCSDKNILEFGSGDDCIALNILRILEFSLKG